PPRRWRLPLAGSAEAAGGTAATVGGVAGEGCGDRVRAGGDAGDGQGRHAAGGGGVLLLAAACKAHVAAAFPGQVLARPAARRRVNPPATCKRRTLQRPGDRLAL